jgi:hypothetical protein
MTMGIERVGENELQSTPLVRTRVGTPGSFEPVAGGAGPSQGPEME